MSCNLHSDEIDLDDRSLFEYVLQLEIIEDSIKNTPPKNPSTFGYMMEPFKSNNKLSDKDEDDEDEDEDDYNKQSSHGLILFIIISIILLITVMIVIYSNSCSMEKSYGYQSNFSTLSPEIGPNVRAIFIRD